jgi:hypothetical protein
VDRRTTEQQLRHGFGEPAGLGHRLVRIGAEIGPGGPVHTGQRLVRQQESEVQRAFRLLVNGLGYDTPSTPVFRKQPCKLFIGRRRMAQWLMITVDLLPPVAHSLPRS